jgi:carboxyl-terminal processing protease
VKRGSTNLKLGILKLPSFYGGAGSTRQSHDDVKRLLKQAETEGADGLVLDLSMNSGGLLTHAVDITGFFVRLGAVVGVRGYQNRDLRDQNPSVEWKGPLVILTSRISASASEIVSGALSDYQRAVLVGDRHTFGKGTVQTIQNFGRDEGAMKVTVARFHRPSGHSTQNAGVEVDITLPSLTDREIFAESEQQYALPTSTVSAFLSDEVNRSGADHWTPVTQPMISELNQKSAQRVKDNPRFSEIQKTLAKLKQSAHQLHLAELLDEPAQDEDETYNKKDELSPQALEAINILADLVTLQK